MAAHTCSKCHNINLGSFVGALINENEFVAAYHAIDNYDMFCFYCDCSPGTIVSSTGKKVFRRTVPLKTLAKRIMSTNYLGRAKPVTLRDSRVVTPRSFLGELGTGKQFYANIQSLDSEGRKIETFQEFAVRAIARNKKKGVTRMSEDTLKTAYNVVLSQVFSEFKQ